MGNFRRNDRFGRGSGRGFGGRDSGRQTMHKATCSDCGKDCEVPFKPTGSKPVYCSDCFRGKENAGPKRFGGRGGRRDSGRFGSGDRQMHKAVCDKCGKNCEVPFRPTGDKPIYCSECFGKTDQGRRSDQKRPDQTSKQFEILNIKLDKILKALSPTISEEVSKKKKVVKKTKTAKLKKVSKEKAKKKPASKKKAAKKKK